MQRRPRKITVLVFNHLVILATTAALAACGQDTGSKMDGGTDGGTNAVASAATLAAVSADQKILAPAPIRSGSQYRPCQ